MKKPKPPYFEDLPDHIQEVIIELIASIVKEKRKKKHQAGQSEDAQEKKAPQRSSKRKPKCVQAPPSKS